MACVYLLTAPTGNQYIGMTRFTAERRFSSHCRLARFGVDSPIGRAIRKHGKESFIVQTLVVADLEYCADFERRAIAAYGAKVPNGYNVAEGGQGAGSLVGEALAKRNAAISLAHSTEEARARTAARASAAWADAEHSQERRASIKAALATDAAQVAMSDAQKRIWADPAEKAKRSAAIKKAFADPEVKARLLAGQQRARAMRNASPGTIHTLA